MDHRELLESLLKAMQALSRDATASINDLTELEHQYPQPELEVETLPVDRTQD